MDTILAEDRWMQWRQSHPGESAILAEGARAWCTSRFWKNHTPRLEHWKLTLLDLYAQALSEEDIEDMAKENSSSVCFPLIPLFESEQISDFFPLVDDVMTAARLAEQLVSASMLGLRSEDVPKVCWELMTASNKKEWDFTAWRWLIFPTEQGDKVWPSEDGIRTLFSDGSQRAAEAVFFLKQVAEERSQAGDGDPGASAALAILDKLRQPPALVELPLADEGTMLRTDEGGSRISAEYRSLYEELFTNPPDVSRWRAVEEVTRLRSADSVTRPPLSAMARDLGQSDRSHQDDQSAWHNLATILEACPNLMKADTCAPQAALPALELAATVRSTVSIGKVAVDLLLLASSSERQDSDWWRALKAGLQAVIRRSGWGLANDRISHAVSVVMFQVWWMNEAERQAMETVFSQEKKHDSQ